MLDSVQRVVEREAQPVKEMFSIAKLENDWREIRINYSSYADIRKCLRKAHYGLDRGLRLQDAEESAATVFGSAIHAALEVWYCAPRTSRRKGSAACDDSQALMLADQAPIPHEEGRCVRCASVYAFLVRGRSLLSLPPDDKRGLANGLGILNDYFDNYADDPFVVLTDDLGPICERQLTKTIVNDELAKVRVTYFGTVDAALRNERTNHILVCDHKTTASLGKDFLQRIHPNFQYVGYVTLFRDAYAGTYDTRTMMSNGIQVAKTKTAFARQYAEVSDGLIAEWREAMLDTAFDYLHRREIGSFPMTAPDACSLYSGCLYRTICEAPNEQKELIIKANYEETRSVDEVPKIN